MHIKKSIEFKKVLKPHAQFQEFQKFISNIQAIVLSQHTKR